MIPERNVRLENRNATPEPNDDDQFTDQIPPAEYCPVSIGTKLVGDRWTLLIVRELISGSSRFNDIHRGLPGLNRSLLTDRLRYLERIGVVERLPLGGSADRKAYTLTSAGRELRPVLMAIGAWTIDWHFPSPPDERCDVSTLLWRMFQGLDQGELSDGSMCIEFRFPDTEPSRGWIRIKDKCSAVCLGSPEHDVDIVVTALPRILYEVWYGFRTLESAIKDEHIALTGSPGHVRDFAHWFRRSPFAERVRAVQDLGGGVEPAATSTRADLPGRGRTTSRRSANRRAV